jgi:mono/diheme cytochrome c family protein
MCHAADGSGNTPFGRKSKLRDLRSQEVQKLTDEQLAEIVARGKNEMPGYAKSLSELQIKELIGSLRRMAGPKAAEPSDKQKISNLNTQQR